MQKVELAPSSYNLRRNVGKQEDYNFVYDL